MDDVETKYEREGGCAFPFTAQGVGGETNEADAGMTLRDYIAIQAMTAMIGTSAGPAIVGGLAGVESNCAAGAYMMADAMLKERSE